MARDVTFELDTTVFGVIKTIMDKQWTRFSAPLYFRQIAARFDKQAAIIYSIIKL